MGKTARLFVIVASVNLVACIPHTTEVAPAHYKYEPEKTKLVGVDTTWDSTRVRDTSIVHLPLTPQIGIDQNYTLVDRYNALEALRMFACMKPADSAAFVADMRLSAADKILAPTDTAQRARDTTVMQMWNSNNRNWLTGRGSQAQASCPYNLGTPDQRIVTFRQPVNLPPASLPTHRDNTRRIGENTGFRNIPSGWHSREQVIAEANDLKVQDRIRACAARNHLNPDMIEQFIDKLKSGKFEWIQATGVASYNLPCGNMPWGRNIDYQNDRGEAVIYAAQVTLDGPFGGTKMDAFGSCANFYFPAQAVDFFIPRWPKPTFTPNPRYAQFRDSTLIPAQYLTTYTMLPCFGGITNALIPHPQNAVQRFGKVVMYGVEVGACGCLAEIGIGAATHGRTALGPCARRERDVVCPPGDKCGPISQPGNCTSCDRVPNDDRMPFLDSRSYYSPGPDWQVNDQSQGIQFAVPRRYYIPIAQISVPTHWRNPLRRGR